MRIFCAKINFFLYIVTLSATLPAFELGCYYAWSASALPKLNGQIDPQSNPLSRPITPKEESWVASLLPLGAAISCFVSGYLFDTIGRKKALMIFAIPRIIGCLLNIFATRVIYFYLGRFLSGFGSGAIFIIVPMYVGEIAEISNRGLLGCFFMIFISLGNLFVFIIGHYVTVQMLSLSIVVPPVLFLLIFSWLAPESPYYLVAKNNLAGAEKSLMKLRCHNSGIVEKELPEVIKYVEESLNKKGGLKDLIIHDRGVLKGFCITTGLVLFQQLSGVNLFFYYMKSIFEETGSSIASDTSMILVGVAQLIGALATSSLVDRLGRRILLLVSSAGTTTSLLCFAAYFFLKNHDPQHVESLHWLPTASIVSFLLTYTIGFGALPYTILGEIFPPHIKSVAATLTIFLCLSFTFSVTNFFPLLIPVIGMPVMYSLLSLFCCIGGSFVYFVVPETKGKSLREIQDVLRK